MDAPSPGLALLAVLLVGAAPRREARDPFAGTWQGIALAQGSRLDLSVSFRRQGAALRAAVSCPDLLALDQPLEDVELSGLRFRFRTRGERPLTFDGVVAGDSIRGAVAAPGRPGGEAGAAGEPTFMLARSGPSPPPPYATRDIHVGSGPDRLAGTLFVPSGAGSPCAGIVLLQSAGDELRTDDLFHADLFARAGLAVLTFDKRGCGESKGDYDAATYEALAGDAAAAVQFLRRQPGVDSARVGVWGAGQGALLAPLVAARVPALRFVVVVGAPAAPIGETAAYQDSVRLVSAGFDQADVMRAVSIERRIHGWLRNPQDSPEVAALLAEAAPTSWRRASSLPARLPSGAALEGWYWRGRTLDPMPAWRGVRAPVLALYGADDELVPARSSGRALERTLRRANNRDVTVRVFPDADHALRTWSDPAGPRWAWPRAAPGALELAIGWVRDHSGTGPAPRNR